MIEERRVVARTPIPDGVEAAVNGVPVKIVELSRIGGRLEHEERFPLESPHLRLAWKGRVVRFPLRVARSEIVSRRESRLVYQTGIQFASIDAEADAVLAEVICNAEAPAAEPSAPEEKEIFQPAPQPKADEMRPSSGEDSWTRQVRFLRRDPEEDLIYVQYRLSEGSWAREFVATPAQPEDGFTVRRDEPDLDELQKTFECADAETRRMMQIALESKLSRVLT